MSWRGWRPDVESRFREVEVVRRRIEAEQAVMLARLEEAKSYRRDGHASMFGFLRAAPHWSETECRSRTKLARLIAASPRCGELLWEGTISVANADAIARLFANPRIADRFESVIGNLLARRRVSEHDDFRRIPERWELLNDPGTRADSGPRSTRVVMRACRFVTGAARLVRGVG